MSGYSALVLVQDISCNGQCGRCRWVGRAVCEMKTRTCCTKTICARTEPETVGNRFLSHNNATHGRRTCTNRAQTCQKRISFTEFLTLLRLLTKKGTGLYHTATTLPVLNGRERTRCYPVIPLSIMRNYQQRTCTNIGKRTSVYRPIAYDVTLSKRN